MTSLHEEATFDDACHLKVVVSSTGVMDGDAGHGGWSEVTFDNDSGSSALFGSLDGAEAGPVNQATIHVKGDAELVVLAQALEWAGRKLRETAGERARTDDEPEPDF